ncbi:unnamed protein product [Arctia plantaginis]|uniref:glutathione transferase n=1 Tax=Arctia plantaginis TaxID=874455 RepID=A0A8S0ZBA9_ARCPL|nr:unnamed protein product [Arctia plantaginis]
MVKVDPRHSDLLSNKFGSYSCHEILSVSSRRGARPHVSSPDIKMPDVTFTYFDVKAVGEGPRLLLAYGGQKFKDIRVTFQEWPQVKPNTPFGFLPVLEIDGKQYATCLAICRYLGKKYGLAGDNDEEALEIDQNVDFLYDIRYRAANTYWEPDPIIKEKKHEENSKLYPDQLKKLNEIIEKNNGHIALGKLTWGDLHFAGMLDYLKEILRMPDLEKKYPAFKKLADNVYSIPSLKAYAASAPAAIW